MPLNSKGLIVLVPYRAGQDYSSEQLYDFWNACKNGTVEYSPEGEGKFDAEFESNFLNEDYLNSEEYVEDYESRCDDCSSNLLEFPKVLLNPETGRLHWAILRPGGDEAKWIVNPSENSYGNSAYLPVFVNTNNTIAALRAVSEYNNSSNILVTEEAFDIPDPGDCICYAPEDEYEVVTIEQMIESLELSTDEYILPEFYDMGDGDEMWKQFQDWCKRILNYELKDRDSLA